MQNPPYEEAQSGHDGGLGTVSHASNPNQGGGDGIVLRDRSAAVDDRSEKTHVAERVKSAPLKIELR